MNPRFHASAHADWGVKPYAEIHALQERLVGRRAQGEIGNLLLTGEHPPVTA